MGKKFFSFENINEKLLLQIYYNINNDVYMLYIIQL